MSVIEKFATMEYGPAPEDAKESLLWLDASKRRFGHFIGGEWRAPADGKYFETNHPSTGQKLPDVAPGNHAGLDAAVEAPRPALAQWPQLSRHPRAAYLSHLA